MSAFYPPSYTFTGINFNSGFFTTPTTGLTQTQANAIYLRKTTPDTASALETFTAGIKTNTINGTGASLSIVSPSITIGANAGSNVVYISAGTGNVIFDTPLVSINNTLNAFQLNTTFLTVSNIDQSIPDDLDIGTTTCTAINIGQVSTPTTIQGVLNTGLITANGGITMGTGKNITLQPNSGYVVPTSAQIGGINSTTTAITTSASGFTNMISISITTGIWIINANMGQNSPTASTFGLTINTSAGGDINSLITTQSTGLGGTLSLHTSRFVVNSSSTAVVYYLVGYSSLAQTMTNIVMSAIRIA